MATTAEVMFPVTSNSTPRLAICPRGTYLSIEIPSRTVVGTHEELALLSGGSNPVNTAWYGI
jgi:hypothetical protein